VEKKYFDKQSALKEGWDFISMNGVDADFCGDCSAGPFVIEQIKKQDGLNV